MSNDRDPNWDPTKSAINDPTLRSEPLHDAGLGPDIPDFLNRRLGIQKPDANKVFGEVPTPVAVKPSEPDPIAALADDGCPHID